ncbi:MAG: GGDEF domain-containing protein [Oceanospirillaceae bacterium]|uniref:bifunctional diguanylate cyclase/phosphodiesterase n=1 Tax=Marinobacterium litorale TaxID=404770 RepID=UPI00040D456E|nr:EAL domain-containing protein [Marinobacterium litorale]MBS98592.1 GGDEF domain-containing protein [Oceanospirillaceae bacterium]
MSLVNQLIAAMFAVLVGLASGTLYIISDSGKQMLMRQLESHAQDSATHLGLYIAPYMAAKDAAAIETAVNAIFDSGFYQRIEVTSPNGDTLFVKDTPPEISESVPTWFVDLIHLTPPEMERSVAHQWRQVGTIHVQSRAGYAYERYWEAAQRTLVLFIALALASGLAISLLLRYLLKPLKTVEEQANALARKQYIEQPELPHTRELRTVVHAMNEMVGQVRHMFEEQAKNIEELRGIAYQDALTGLYNERATLAQLRERVEYDRDFGPSSLLLIQLPELGRLNSECGEDATNHYLKQVADELSVLTQTARRPLCGRIGGGLFLVLLPQQPLQTLRAPLDLIYDHLANRLASLYENRTPPLPAVVGLSHSGDHSSADELISQARLALKQALDRDQRYAEYRSIRGQEETTDGWHHHVAAAINNGQVFLQYQQLLDPDGQQIHGELLARILDEQNEPCPAGRFIGVARELGLLDAMDRAVLVNAINYLKREPRGIRISVNLGQDALLSDGFIQWLDARLKDLNTPDRLQLEINETTILNNPEAVRSLREASRHWGIGFGVDNFGIHPSGFSYLYAVKPDYLKIDGSLIREIDHSDEDRFFVRSLVGVAHNIHIKAYAEHVERETQRSTLITMGIDGVQGFLHGQPAPLT